MVELSERHIAILRVKKMFDIDSVSVTNYITQGSSVNIVRFYDNHSSRKSFENRVSGYFNKEHTYELQNHLTNGLSGSPVFLDWVICGVTQAISRDRNITYIIPISEVCVKMEDLKKIDSNTSNEINNVPVSLGDFKESISSIIIPFGITFFILVLIFKFIYPSLELSDTVYVFILVSFVIAKTFVFLLKRFRKIRDKK
jgi:hypothetical protein